MTVTKEINFLVVFSCLILGVVSTIYECKCIDNICQLVLEVSDNCTNTGANILTIPVSLLDSTQQRLQLVARNLSLKSTSKVFEKRILALKKIVSIDLSDNELSELQYKEFIEVGNVEILNVSNNQLKTVDQNAFAGLFNLEVLVLAGNQLSEIPIYSFTLLKKLHTINLRKNDLKILDVYPFASANNLKNLFLESNYIQTIKSSPLDSGVQELILKDNQLTDIEELRNFKSTVKLDLTSNTNLKLTNGSFQGWRLLEYLIIDNIDLKGSETLANILRSAGCCRLREISMSSNAITNLKIADFARLDKLVSLKINDNQLKEFDYDQLKVKFPEFQQIALAGNLWNTTFLNAMAKHFKHRNIKISSCLDEILWVYVVDFQFLQLVSVAICLTALELYTIQMFLCQIHFRPS